MTEFDRLVEICRCPLEGPGVAERGEADIQRSSVTRIDRDRLVRFRMLELHGSRCLFSGAAHHSLDGRRHAVQVGHLLPLKHGGPDVLQNVMPMSAIVNWLWDEGIITLLNSGVIRISDRASDEDRAVIGGRHQIAFPKDPRFWPRAEYLEAHRDLIFDRLDGW